ncbi:hypothetical protein DPMN_063010 [Dreissena polymorpha]|uniref:Uncharacterized protein n=1 Tax=Dreissena polymorpha TaxID=45954 RepID=A0A9D4C9P9_DREPO|nr:hypothetical protein DPMN_063010 [Dreissena polymorpha]
MISSDFFKDRRAILPVYLWISNLSTHRCEVVVAEWLKVGSHCRSDQLDHPDHQNVPTKPDKARLKRVYMTSSRPLVDNTRPPHDSFTTSTQPSFQFPLDHLDLYDLSSTKWTSARSPPDLHTTRS